MQSLSRIILFFAILFAIFLIGPALLSQQFAPYPLMKNGDVFDIFTPLVLMPFYWLMFRVSEERPVIRREILLFILFAALWIEGQGMHLGANSIGHLLKNAKGTDGYQLTFFYDEVLGHYLWHLGSISLVALILYRQWKYPFVGAHAGLTLEIIAGVIYGLTFFIVTIEAGTSLIGIPFALVVSLFGLIRGRAVLRQQPLLAFFLIAYLVAIVMFLGWGAYWRGLPQFSEVGIIE